MSDVDDTVLTGGCRRFDVNCFNATNLRNRWPVPEFQGRSLPRNAPKLTLTLTSYKGACRSRQHWTLFYFATSVGVRLLLTRTPASPATSTEYCAKAQHEISQCLEEANSCITVNRARTSISIFALVTAWTFHTIIEHYAISRIDCSRNRLQTSIPGHYITYRACFHALKMLLV